MTQTAAKHTPGPWAVDPDRPTEICVASDGAMVASTDFFGDGAATAVEANARLIAAAPEILEILIEQTDAVQAVIDNWSSGNLAAAVNALEGLIEPARAIIAKATA